MGRPAPGTNLTRFTSRLIAGVAGAALLIVAQASTRLRLGASVDVLHSAAPVGVLPALHPVPVQRLSAESRSVTRWSGGFGAALPAAAYAARSGHAARNVLAGASAAHNAPAAERGYDATAPPALS